MDIDKRNMLQKVIKIKIAIILQCKIFEQNYSTNDYIFFRVYAYKRPF